MRATRATDRSRPTDTVTLELDRRGATAERRLPAAQGGDVELVLLVGDVYRDRARLRRSRRVRARQQRVLRIDLREIARDAQAHHAKVGLEADTRGLLSRATSHVGNTTHGRDLGARATVERVGSIGSQDRQAIVRFDLTQHVRGHLFAQGPEAVLVRLRGVLRELDLHVLTRRRRAAAEEHDHGLESGLVGDDLVDTGGEAGEGELAAIVGQHTVQGKIGELVGVHPGRGYRGEGSLRLRGGDFPEQRPSASASSPTGSVTVPPRAQSPAERNATASGARSLIRVSRSDRSIGTLSRRCQLAGRVPFPCLSTPRS